MPAARPLRVWLAAGGVGLAALAFSVARPEASQARAPCANADTSSRKISQGEARRAVRCLVNSERGGLRSLALRKNLNGPALRHSKKMQEHRCLLHVCPGEPPTLSQRLKRYVANGSDLHVAEVIAVNGAGASPRDVVRQWTNSPSHRELLMGKFKHLGVGIATGGDLTYYTVDLGWKS